MKVTAVSWVGIKSADPDPMIRFFRNVLGLTAVVDEPSFTVFELSSGDKIEIFGPEGPDPEYQFATGGVVAGLSVDDIDSAAAEIAAAGLELLGTKQTAPDGYAWQHFRAPDGRVFSLTSDPPPVSEPG